MFGQRIFEHERDKLVQKGTDNLRKEFDEKLSTLNINQKIELSAKINETRIKRMRKRNDCVEKLREEAKDKLITRFGAGSKQYKEVMKKLIIQVSAYLN